jgi:hypothetical protein
MTTDAFIGLIDHQIYSLELMKGRNTVLIPGILASIATLKHLRSTVEDINEVEVRAEIRQQENKRL